MLSKIALVCLLAALEEQIDNQAIDPPAGAYYASLLKTEYDWDFKSVPQPTLGNRVVSQPRGKVK